MKAAVPYRAHRLLAFSPIDNSSVFGLLIYDAAVAYSCSGSCVWCNYKLWKNLIFT